MIEIEENVITIIKGDTAHINLTLDNAILTNGDTVYFTVKSKIDNSSNVIQKIITGFENGIAKIELTTYDTNINPSSYVYDVQVSFADGRVDTVILPNKFKVKRGVTE